LTYTTASAVNYPENLFQPDNNNFGPRIGVAFKLDNKTVLRGGYGEYFWTMPLSQLLQAARTNPPLNLRFVNRASDKNATFNYPLIARPVGTDFIGGATVDTQGVVPISSGAQQIAILARQRRARIAFPDSVARQLHWRTRTRSGTEVFHQ
jgi:hypothetical protein